MKRLRLTCSALLVWFFVLFNVERFHEPLHLASFVYLLAGLVAIALVGLKPLSSLPHRWLLAAPVAAFFLIKAGLGLPLVGEALPITIVELAAIATTVALAHHVSCSLHGFEEASTGMLVGDPLSLETAQSVLYQEVRRARQHDRPLSVLAVEPTGQSLSRAQERFVRELQREMLEKYTSGRVADLLTNKANRRQGIVAQCDGHFVMLLPETDRETAEETVRDLNLAARSGLGLDLRVGISAFPQEEVTLVGLLRRAEADMRTDTNGRQHSRTLTSERPIESTTDTVGDYQATTETIVTRLQNAARLSK